MRNTTNELYHHGILGQKWGKRNGPPYPLGASDRSATETKLSNNKDYGSNWWVDNTKEIKLNKDGSYTVPPGFKFNRVGGSETRANLSGGLYVSYGKADAARYVRNLGPSLCGKLMKQYGTHVQHISVKKPLKLASEQETINTTLNALKDNPEFFNKLKDTWLYSMSYSSEGIQDSDLESALSDPTSKQAKKLAYCIMASFGNSVAAPDVAKIYDVFRAKGYDAIPDVYDIMNGISESAMIVLNMDKIEMTDSREITKDIYKEGKRFAKEYGYLKVDEIVTHDIVK